MYKAGKTPERISLMDKNEPLFVGIDVAKEQLDVAFSSGRKPERVRNEPKMLKRLAEDLVELQPALVLMEATGGLERPLAYALEAAGLPYRIANPRLVRDFARATGRLAKTDRIDAKVLGEFARRLEPEPRPLPNPDRLTLRDLVVRRQQLIDMRTQDENRRGTAPKVVGKQIDGVIRYLDKEIKKIEQQIDDFLDQHPQLRAEIEVLESVKGVGPVTSHTLCGLVGELGFADRKQIAALIGVAPFNCDSGHFRGKRSCWGGRAGVRKVLYMAALVASYRNPVLADFYQRLRRQGKPFKVAIAATMRKLLVILNAKMRDHYAAQAA
jgi:transposase